MNLINFDPKLKLNSSSAIFFLSLTLLHRSEWQDLFPGGNRQTSRYAYPVSIALPTTVNLQTNVKIIEDSGIKNFNLTGLSYQTDEEGKRYLVLDFQMYGRWVSAEFRQT